MNVNETQNIEVDISKEIGVSFLDYIKTAEKRLWIVSPWLSPEYAKIAVDRKENEVDVKIITTNNYVRGHKEALRELIDKKKKVIKEENRGLKIGGILSILIGILALILTFASPYFVIFGVILIIIGQFLISEGKEKAEIFFESKLGNENLIVYGYMIAHPLHAKVYVADDRVIIGSANLTKNGLVKSTESVAIMNNAKISQDMINKISGINKWIRKKISIDQVATDIQV